MRIVARSHPPAENVVQVVSWGPEPIGEAQVDALHARFGADMAGLGTIPGWGLQGSQEATDQAIWASPQAFSGAAGAAAAFSALGAAPPTVYPQHADAAGVVLPGPGGV
jgi:hypothetical protein